MFKVWVQEEKVSSGFLRDTGHHLAIDGHIKKAYHINAQKGEDQVDDNREYLTKFLIQQGKYPLYFTIIGYEEYGDLEETIKIGGLQYRLNFLEESRPYWTDGKNLTYQPPCFTVEVTDEKELTYILEETYWLPTQNDFYAISTTENLYFNLEEVMEWGRRKKRSAPHFRSEENSTFVTIFHDGYGFYLFSNEEKYSSIQNLCVNLPPKTDIKQINDELVNGGWD
ncbi:hypothetical protein [Priestia megaterium]|uniref:Uncharacterized protein n=1 Tax=Priestia megaterium TaxID=1404 RepID=A0A6M6DZ56_PRIMG|nr:hypothetical protein [Priestia megaterium]QJX80062.1 hypothetical protein FDZ14_28615 [Priestia megaterium]